MVHNAPNELMNLRNMQVNRVFALHDNAHFRPRNMLNDPNQRHAEELDVSLDDEFEDEMEIPEENVVAMQASNNSIHPSAREGNLVIDLPNSTNKCHSNDLKK